MKSYTRKPRATQFDFLILSSFPLVAAYFPLSSAHVALSLDASVKDDDSLSSRLMITHKIPKASGLKLKQVMTCLWTISS